MKQKNTILILLIVFTITLSAIIISMAKGIINSNIIESNDDNVFVESDTIEDLFIDDYYSTWVNMGNLEIYECTSGLIEFDYDAINTFVSEKLSLSMPNLYVKVGSYVKEGMVLYSIDGTDYKSEIDGLILSIHQNEYLYIKILDFNKSYIKTNINSLNQNYITDNTKIILINPIDMSESKSTLIEIIPYTFDNKINIKVSNPFELFEMTNIDIKIIYDVLENVIYTEKKFLQYDMAQKKWYVQVLNNGRITERVVQLKYSNDTYAQLINCDDLIGQAIYKLKYDNSLEDD